MTEGERPPAEGRREAAREETANAERSGEKPSGEHAAEARDGDGSAGEASERLPEGASSSGAESLPRKVVRNLRFHGDRWALIGGAVTMLVISAGRLFVGRLYSESQALSLYESLSQSSLYLGSAVVTGASTILALMLTVVGLADRADTRFSAKLFNIFYTLGLFSVGALIGAVLTLAVSALPSEAVDELPPWLYSRFYTVLVVLVALLSGLMVTVVLMLFQAIRTIILAYHPDYDDISA